MAGFFGDYFDREVVQTMIAQDRAYTDVVKPEVGAQPTVVHLTQEHDLQRVASVSVDSTMPDVRDGRIAYVISQVGSPPVLASATMALVASTLSSSRAWMWAGIYVTLAILTPLLYLFWLVRHGRVTDLDVQLREQRMRPLLFTIACNGAAWIVLILGAAPSLMVVLAGVLWVQMSAIFAITLFWKISVHCAAAAVAATLIWSLTGTPLPLLIGVPIIAWSRVHLRRHTVPQTVGGALLGIAVFLAGLYLVYGR